MDYAQVFCGAIATAYFIWVAQSWWGTDRDAMRFHGRVWYALIGAAALLAAYQFGVLEGGDAVLRTWRDAMEPWAQAAGTTTVASGQRPLRHIDSVRVPGWAFFYLVVLSAEILVVTSMPDRKRSQSDTNLKP